LLDLTKFITDLNIQRILSLVNQGKDKQKANTLQIGMLFAAIKKQEMSLYAINVQIVIIYLALEKRIMMKKYGYVKSVKKVAPLMVIDNFPLLLKLNIETKYQLYISTLKSLIIIENINKKQSKWRIN
jgi:hypothetical protein